MPEASVIVPSFRGAGRLPNLLACLAAQTFTDFEVVVVLDGDVDNSQGELGKWPTLTVRPVVFPENRGRAAALTAGFTHADGSVLIRCDDDLRPSADFVHHHVRHHRAGQCGVVGLYRNNYRGSRYGQVYGHSSEAGLHQLAFSAPPENRWRFWAGNCSVTREVYDKVGPYDARFDRYGWEDGDWGYRLHQVGVPIVIDPQLTTDHDVPATDTVIRAGRAFHSGSSQRIFEQKHGIVVSPDAPRSTWSRMVDARAAKLTEQRVTSSAGRVDRLLPFVPSPIGRKLVAFSVESAYQAGRRNSDELVGEW